MPSANVEDLKPLTSLRAIAAMAIVFFHLHLAFHWNWLSHVPNQLFYGVSFFFVLSGFILTHVYSVRPASYGQFMLARFARLWPTHVTMIAAAAILLPPDSLGFRDPGYFDLAHTIGPVILMVQAWIPYQAYYWAWNSPSWSISTEFFFYLLFPFLLINIERTWHWKLALSVMAGLAMVVLTIAIDPPPDIFADRLTLTSFLGTFPLAHLFEFCLGMSAYVLWRHVVSRWQLSARTWSMIELAAAASCLAWVAYMGRLEAIMPDIPALNGWLKTALTSIGFTGLIVGLASGRGAIGRILSHPFPVYLGLISYAIYLSHRLILAIFGLYDAALPEPVQEIGFFALLFACSALSYHLVETPTRAWLTSLRIARWHPATTA